MKRTWLTFLLLLTMTAHADTVYVNNRPLKATVTGSGSQVYVELGALCQALKVAVQPAGQGWLVGEGTASLGPGQVQVAGQTLEGRVDKDGHVLVPLKQTAELLGHRVIVNPALGTVDVYLAAAQPNPGPSAAPSSNAYPGDGTAPSFDPGKELWPVADPTAGLVGYQPSANDHSRWVIPPQFFIADYFSDGLARVVMPGPIETVDSPVYRAHQSGTTISAGPEDVIKVNKVRRYSWGKCGYIDRTGRFVIPAIYGNGTDFWKGYARVEKTDSQRTEMYIDKTGRRVPGEKIPQDIKDRLSGYPSGTAASPPQH